MRILYHETEISRRVSEIGQRIASDFAGRELLVLGILKGAAIFTSDLVRAIPAPVKLEFVHAASYAASTSSCGAVQVGDLPQNALRDRHILLVDTIADTGHTLAALQHALQDCGAASVTCAVLLNKPHRRVVEISIAYIGFEAPDEFIVGYGMDYAGDYRNLPYIAALPHEDAS